MHLPSHPAHKTKLAPIVIIALLILIPVGCFSYALVLQKTGRLTPIQKEVKSAAVVNEQIKQRKEMVAKAKEQVSLPTDEEPQFATVSNKDLLGKQEFFKDAQNGDKILMYRKNKKAFLYRPATKQVLTWATLQTEVPTPTADPSASTSAAAPQPAPQSGTGLDVSTHGKVLIRPDL